MDWRQEQEVLSLFAQVFSRIFTFSVFCAKAYLGSGPRNVEWNFLNQRLHHLNNYLLNSSVTFICASSNKTLFHCSLPDQCCPKLDNICGCTLYLCPEKLSKVVFDWSVFVKVLPRKVGMTRDMNEAVNKTWPVTFYLENSEKFASRIRSTEYHMEWRNFADLLCWQHSTASVLIDRAHVSLRSWVVGVAVIWSWMPMPLTLGQLPLLISHNLMCCLSSDEYMFDKTFPGSTHVLCVNLNLRLVTVLALGATNRCKQTSKSNKMSKLSDRSKPYVKLLERIN